MTILATLASNTLVECLVGNVQYTKGKNRRCGEEMRGKLCSKKKTVKIHGSGEDLQMNAANRQQPVEPALDIFLHCTSAT